MGYNDGVMFARGNAAYGLGALFQIPCCLIELRKELERALFVSFEVRSLIQTTSPAQNTASLIQDRCRFEGLMLES